jgi:hypothetical protein
MSGYYLLQNNSNTRLAIWTFPEFVPTFSGYVEIGQAYNSGYVKVGETFSALALSMAAIEAYNAKHPHRPVDPETHRAAQDVTFRKWDGDYVCESEGAVRVIIL